MVILGIGVSGDRLIGFSELVKRFGFCSDLGVKVLFKVIGIYI